jgi:hypothetical protein
MARWVDPDRPPRPSGVIDWWEQDFLPSTPERKLNIWDLQEAIERQFRTRPTNPFAPKQPEQYGISDDTNDRARRLIESALGDDHA